MARLQVLASEVYANTSERLKQLLAEFERRLKERKEQADGSLNGSYKQSGQQSTQQVMGCREVSSHVSQF